MRHRISIRLRQYRKIPAYHRLGIGAIAIAFGISAMQFYVGAFTNYFDATMVPLANGAPLITATGWVVFFWTAIFISVLFYGCAEQTFYAFFIVSLKSRNLRYRPLHQDRAGGAQLLMLPSLMFAYAMIALLVIFFMFIIQDRILYQIDESNRLWGLVLYILIIVPLFFLPFWHLHKLMKIRRDEYLLRISGILDNIVMAPGGQSIEVSSEKYERFIHSMDYVEKYRKTIAEFPIWPLPFSSSASPIGSVIAALIPLLQKVAGQALAHFYATPT